MKATIIELYDTGREIISFDYSEFDAPTKISDLKKCENVIIGNKKHGMTEILIDNNIHLVLPGRYSGVGGTIFFLEILY